MPFTTIVTTRDEATLDGPADGLAAALASAAGARVVAVDVDGAEPSAFGTGSDFSSARALRRVMAAEDAELLVLEASERDHGGEAASALWTLHGAPCAVAIAPAGAPRAIELRRIGVGVDTGPESRLALSLAYDLARRTGAALALFAVVDDGLPGWMASYSDGPTISEALVQRRLAVALELLSELMETCPDVPVGGKLLVGHPAHQLLRASDDVDLLALGSRRSGPAGRLALGTTSERLLRDATVPLLIAPRAEDGHRFAAQVPVRTLNAIA
jgi:nucleotide-binding universal stress UspA family protein